MNPDEAFEALKMGSLVKTGDTVGRIDGLYRCVNAPSQLLAQVNEDGEPRHYPTEELRPAA